MTTTPHEKALEAANTAIEEYGYNSVGVYAAIKCYNISFYSNPDVVEDVAKAIIAYRPALEPDLPWHYINEATRQIYRDQAQAALSVLRKIARMV